jgi:hypothetical protein
VHGRVVDETIESVVDAKVDWLVERVELPPEPGIVISVVWVGGRVVVVPELLEAPV